MKKRSYDNNNVNGKNFGFKVSVAVNLFLIVICFMQNVCAGKMNNNYEMLSKEKNQITSQLENMKNEKEKIELENEKVLNGMRAMAAMYIKGVINNGDVVPVCGVYQHVLSKAGFSEQRVASEMDKLLNIVLQLDDTMAPSSSGYDHTSTPCPMDL